MNELIGGIFLLAVTAVGGFAAGAHTMALLADGIREDVNGV